MLAWPLLRRLPDGPSGPAAPVAGSAGLEGAASARPSVLLLVGTGLLWAVTQGVWSYASVLGRQHTGMSHSAVSRKPVPSPKSWLAAGTPMISSAVTPTTPAMVTADALSASLVAASAAVAAA
ncbi:hypothetical protein [Streptomyces sp. NPDC006668]|uniref:hypothetical protein n=1 Tax=Streptomyces sp. NPDC006668 TaxID=3156903 RepID=UPI0033F4A809